jgi:DnaK suppressor protein
MAKASKRTTVAAPEKSRYEELKRMLQERQRELTTEVQGRIRGVRADGAEKPHDVMDQGETSEVDIQEDIELALIQMKAETLNKINEALTRLETDRYGFCFECGEEISEARLRALPFAVRCKDCEEARENAANRERMLSQRRGSSSLFYDLQG